jgi:ABC-2 type transport system permease protein
VTASPPWTPGPVPDRATRPAHSPLTLRVELARQWTRRRTRIVLLILAALPVVIWLSFVIGAAVAGDAPPASGGAADIAARAQESGANFVAFTLFLTAGFLLTIVVALFFGDMLAGEASWSTLKYLLTLPVPRTRLFVQKALVAAILTAAGIAALVLVATAVGVAAYGTGPLRFGAGTAIPLEQALPRIAGATGVVAVQLLWAAALGALLSAATDSPLGAAGGVVLVTILSTILDQVTVLGDLRVLLPTHFDDAYRQLLVEPPDTERILSAVLSGLLYALVLTTLAIRRFARKDITS